MKRHFSTHSRVVKDLFAKYSSTFSAFCELINNSIQANSKNVDITIDYVKDKELHFSIFRSIIVKDDGNGVPLSELENKILNIGTDVKDGGKGIGRFASIQIGSNVTIETVSFDQKLNKSTKAIIPLKQEYFTSGKEVNEVEIDTIEEELINKHESYYQVKIENIYDKNVWEKFPEVKISPKFQEENISHSLFERYPLIIFNEKTKFHINKKYINPKSFIDGEPEHFIEEYKSLKGEDHSIEFNFIKLKPDLNKIKVFITVENSGIQTVAGSFDYDADWLSPKIGTWFIYISSEYFNFDMFRNLDITEMDEKLKHLNEFTKSNIDKFFRDKNKEYSDFTTELKEDDHYPFKQKESSSSIKQIVFDKVAYLVEEKHHILRKKNTIRELIYPLIDKAITNGGFKNIIVNILNLDDSMVEKFNNLLEKVELEDIINFSEKVSKYIEDLEFIEKLIYGDIANHIKERKQLHKVLERMLWIFGEQYADSTVLLSDKNLGKNLKEIRDRCLKYEEDDSKDNLVDIDNSDIKSITDLFLFSEKIIDEKNKEVLILELKAPKVRISHKELNQVKQYAYEIEESGILPNRLIYKIYLLSAHFTKRAKSELNGTQTTAGIPYFYWRNENQNIEIYVIEWSDIIETTKRRLNYMASELKVKDLSVKDKIIKDFSDIDFEDLKSRLKKSKVELIN